jgi:hypothetical protein
VESRAVCGGGGFYGVSECVCVCVCVREGVESGAVCRGGVFYGVCVGDCVCVCVCVCVCGKVWSPEPFVGAVVFTEYVCVWVCGCACVCRHEIEWVGVRVTI